MNENPECKMCEKHADTIERLQARIAELEASQTSPESEE